MIVGIWAFKWYNSDLFFQHYSGEISGLRSGTSNVVIRGSFPNNDTKPIFVPNNDTPAKFKQNNYLFRKTTFSCFLSGKPTKTLPAIL